jgi:endoglucanase
MRVVVVALCLLAACNYYVTVEPQSEPAPGPAPGPGAADAGPGAGPGPEVNDAGEPRPSYPASSASPDSGAESPQDSGREPGPGDASEPSPSRTPGYLHTAGAQIVDHLGTPVRITGISWFGFETCDDVLHGLWARSMGSLLDQVRELGFNTLRIPYSNEMLARTSPPRGSFDVSLNPALVGQTPFAILDQLVAEAGARGLKIILDRHRPSCEAQSELWYTEAYSEQRWIDDWVMLAQHYAGDTTVVGFDLHNEPHGAASWGGDPSSDWKKAAERAGNAVLAINPELLIIVEGVEHFESHWYWWGGNLRGASSDPLVLAVPNQLVYSPHDYPASIYAQPWFSDPMYPNNLPALWDATWGGIAKSNAAPILIGEFGTKLETQSDADWLRALADYIAANELSFTYWALNPNSGDTGGILGDDWTSVQESKHAVLAPLLAPEIR